MKKLSYLTLFAATILVACGGGGGSSPAPTPLPVQSPPPPPPPPPPPAASGPGLLLATFDPPLNLRVGNRGVPGDNGPPDSSSVLSIRSVQNDPNSRVKIEAIAGHGEFDYASTDNVIIEGDFGSIEYIDSPSFFASGTNTPEFSVVSEVDDKLYWYTREQGSFPDTFSVASTIDIESPCFVEGTPTLSAGDIVIGQRNQGLTVLEISVVDGGASFNSAVVSTAGTGRSLCFFMRLIIPESVHQQFPGVRGPNRDIAPMTALDFDTKEIVFFGDTDGDFELEELDAVPLLGSDNPDLRIVDVMYNGSASLPYDFYVLLTDDNHIGDHRLISVHYDQNDELVQNEITWEEGVPVALSQGYFGGERLGFDMIVALSTSDQALYFDDLRQQPPNWGRPPVYGDPVRFEVGLGAGSAITARSQDVPVAGDPSHSILVSYPDSGELRQFTLELGQ